MSEPTQELSALKLALLATATVACHCENFCLET